jgi:hypothetical protein
MVEVQATRMINEPCEGQLDSYSFYLSNRLDQNRISYNKAPHGFAEVHTDYLSDMSSMVKDSLLLELLIESHKGNKQFFKDNMEAILSALSFGGRNFYSSRGSRKREGLDVFKYSPLRLTVQSVLPGSMSRNTTGLLSLAFTYAQKDTFKRAVDNFTASPRCVGNSSVLDDSAIYLDVLAPMLTK